MIFCFEACVGGSERPCHGNGMCDGDGTRGGNGKCTCDHGYKGELCLDCVDGHFNEVRNDTFSLCTGTLEHTQTEPAAAVAPPAFSLFHIHTKKAVSDKSAASLNSCFASSYRMPFVLQNLYWSNQSRL